MPVGFDIPQRKFQNIAVGARVRGSIRREWTYRVQHGNGFYGTLPGVLYQHKFPYAPNDPTASHVGPASKSAMASAMAAWAALTSDQKNLWRSRVKERNLQMHGVNLFVKNHILGTL